MMCIITNVSVFVFALGAAAYVTDGPDVPLLEARLIVEDGDAISLHHKGKRWDGAGPGGVAVVIGILIKNAEKPKSKFLPFLQKHLVRLHLEFQGCEGVSGHLNKF